MPGSAVCIANLLITQKRLESVSKNAVKKFAKDTLKESQTKLTPKDKGDLRKSGYIRDDKDTPTEFYMRIGFNTPYALKQHETPWYHHPVGQWKYLSTPLLRRSPVLIKELENVWRGIL